MDVSVTFVQDEYFKLKKRCFFAFFANFVAIKCLEKREKTLFSHTFCRTSCKKLKKLCFCIFCELCTMCLEKHEKTLFSHTFCWMSILSKNNIVNLQCLLFADFLGFLPEHEGQQGERVIGSRETNLGRERTRR